MNDPFKRKGGNGESNPKFQPLPLDLNKCNNLPCTRCGVEYYLQAYVIKVISPLMSRSGQEEFMPVPAFLCTKCGLVAGTKLDEEQKKGDKKDDEKDK